MQTSAWMSVPCAVFTRPQSQFLVSRLHAPRRCPAFPHASAMPLITLLIAVPITCTSRLRFRQSYCSLRSLIMRLWGKYFFYVTGRICASRDRESWGRRGCTGVTRPLEIVAEAWRQGAHTVSSHVSPPWLRWFTPRLWSWEKTKFSVLIFSF